MKSGQTRNDIIRDSSRPAPGETADKAEVVINPAEDPMLPFGRCTEAKQVGQRWYVFRSLSRLEGLAEFNLTAQGFVHFLPKVLVTRRHARRFITERQWVFPRYGFVAFDIAHDRWRSINGTIGVERLIMGENGPQPVPVGIVEALQASIDDRGLFDIDCGLKPGAAVRVNRGIFAGALGTLQSLDAKGRVELLMEWLNGSVRLKIERDSVEAAA